MKYRILTGLALLGLAVGYACGKEDPTDPNGTSTGTGTGSSGTTNADGTCALTNNTTATATVNSYGCALLTRDTTSCDASRAAQGLTGAWLKFSCRVTLTKSGTNVVVATDGLPDSKSPYFGSSDACYAAMSSTATAAGRAVNPNKLATSSLSLTIPMSGTAASSATSTNMGAIGIAVNGVAIYSNAAGPGDDIYNEIATFDQCQGHPVPNGQYHYHIEPPTIANADAKLIGIMRDGFPIYGIQDVDGSTPTVDSAGGHTGTTIDSPSTAVYHYHAAIQTNGTTSAYFLSTAKYKGTAGACTGC